ncbi:Upc2 protein [Dactylonectria estremocensis]|uniref:Upc2 protein n=1 Tax=Dactylonectria estremocensis TaxID=1079267 RepID=A0A9P9I9J2_9HYPO|nr:Upc2 protein [Dactylonectria estremocensis]
MARRAHLKSRLGCRVCKQRKVKCDERKPVCDRCVTAGRRCSYLGDAPDIPTPASSLSVPSRDASQLPTTPQLTPGSCDATASVHDPHEQPLCLDNPSLTEERFSLAHLELLDHIRNSMTPSGPVIHYAIERGYKLAFRAPYLMDQLLAFAAAHKSTVAREDGDERLERFFRMESTKLQTRALSGVNLASDAVNKDNADALFVFSAFLGHHVLFDTFSAREPLPVMLDKLTQCFELHQSIRFTAAAALRAVADMYCETVNILQYLLDSSQSSASERRVGVVQEWLVRVPYEYLTYLRQRRPEAIVILAYYAVLLHRARHNWAVGDAGRFLIQEVGSHLGDYWTDWLAWPQQALENS